MNVLTVDYKSSTAPALFCESLKKTGFAVLNNHPIDSDLIQDAYHQWQNFFNSEDKYNYIYQKGAQEGYFPFRTEKAKNSAINDLKEFYHFYSWGRVPSQLKSNAIQISKSLTALASELLQWIENHLPPAVAKTLSQPLNQMIIDSPNTLLRILHYPPLTQPEPNAVRAAPHEDINLITLLPAATAPGLEVLDTQGNWHAVNCDPGNIVVNVGDMLQMCTEYYYISTTHRVVNPEAKQNKSRFSMPLFLHPRPEVMLSATQNAKAYLEQRLREIGIY